MNTIQSREHEQRGIAFAILLLTAGVIWLLFTLNIIPAAGVNIALRLWPLALIAIGADLLLRDQSRQIAMYIVLAIAVFVVLAAIIAPPLGIGVLETNSGTYTEQLADAESARINLHHGVGDLNVTALENSDLLFSAEATYLGEVDFTVRGTAQRQIDFGQNAVSTSGWMVPAEDLYWNIGLTPEIPLRLELNTGVGDTNLDLTALNLESLNVNGGVGHVNVALPEQDASYQVDISGGVGSVDVEIPENTDIIITVEGGVGDLRLNLPEGAPVRVSVSSGLGNSQIASWLERVDTGDRQVWQSANYDAAARRITVDVSSGLGNLIIR